MKNLFYAITAIAFSFSLQAQNVITTYAGNGSAGYSGDGGPATSATTNFPVKAASDAVGNIYFADNGNNVIRKVDLNGIITTIAGTGTAGYSGDGGPATAGNLNGPWGLDVHNGYIYFCDGWNNVIRKINITTGIITLVAGAPGVAGYSGDNGPATSALLNTPTGIGVDPAGNVYISDDNNNRLRKIDIDGIITTFAGTGVGGFSGDGGPADAAQIWFPVGVSTDLSGNVYLSDNVNHRIRKINTSGIINTVAGNGSPGYNGDGIPATSAKLYNPWDAAVDLEGNLYIADFFNYCIRKVDASTGIISTYAGTPGVSGFSGDGSLATDARMNAPVGLCIDNNGNVVIVDSYNNCLRKISQLSLFGGIGLFVPGCGGYPTVNSAVGFPCGGNISDDCFRTICQGTILPNVFVSPDQNTNAIYPYNQSYGLTITPSQNVSVTAMVGSPGHWNLTFNAPGTYSVQGFFGGGSDPNCAPPDEPGPVPLCWGSFCTNNVVITVLPNPLNPQLALNPNPTCAGDQVCFTQGNIPSGTYNYTFNTGIGTSYQGNQSNPLPNPFCICPYPVANTYNATLTFSDNNGCKAKATVPVIVNPIQANPSFAQSCEVFNFMANPVNCVLSGASYLWNFGDGSTSTTQNPQHIYNTSGAFNVTLSITSGCAVVNFNLTVNPILNCCTNTNSGRTSTIFAANSSNNISTSFTNVDFTAQNNATILINSPTVNNTVLNITFTGCTFLMFPGSKIVINTKNTIGTPHNSTLNVKFIDCHLYGCSQLWEGIVFTHDVFAGENIFLNTNLEITKTLLEDAWNGVDNSAAFIGALAPKITIDNSMFNNNSTDLFLDQERIKAGSLSKKTSYNSRNVFNALNYTGTYYPPFAGLPNFNNPIPYYNNVVSPLSPGNVKPSALHSFSGATFGTYGIRLFFTTASSFASNQFFDLASNQNIYDRHLYGIYGQDINLTIAKQYFFNLPFTGILSDGFQTGGNGGKPTLTLGTSNQSANSFSNCGTGILARYQTQKLTASYNTIRDIVYGIYVDGFGTANSSNYNCTIVSNNIKNPRLSAIHFNLSGAINANVQNNHIFYTSPSLRNFTSKGIVANENGSVNALYNIDNNNIQYTYTGIECFNTYKTQITNNDIQINTPPVFPSSAPFYNYGVNNINCYGNSIGENTIKGDNVQNHAWQFGINSVDHPMQNIYCNDITGTYTGLNLQGPSMTPANPDLPIRNNSLHDELIDIFMLNGCVLGPQRIPFLPGINFPVGNTFDHTGGTYLYNSYCAGSPATFGNLSRFYIISNGQFAMPINSAQITPNPISSPMNPVLLTGGGLPNPCNNASGNTHRVINLAHMVAVDSLFAPSEARNRFTSRRNLFHNIKLETVNTSGDAALAGFEANESAGNIGTLYMIEKNASDAIAQDNQSLLSQADQMNSNLIPVNSFENLHQRVNTAYINYLGNNSFTSADLTDLRQIAVLCPFTDGPAVWQARSLLAGIDSIPYFNPCEIISMPSGSGQRQSFDELIDINKDLESKIFPNPNSGNFHVIFSGKGKNMVIEVYDVLGELFISKQYELSDASKMAIEGLPDGIYLVKLIIDGIHNKTERIIVTK